MLGLASASLTAFGSAAAAVDGEWTGSNNRRPSVLQPGWVDTSRGGIRGERGAAILPAVPETRRAESGHVRPFRVRLPKPRSAAAVRDIVGVEKYVCNDRNRGIIGDPISAAPEQQKA